MKKYKIYLHTTSKKAANRLISVTSSKLVTNSVEDNSLVVVHQISQVSDILSPSDLELSIINQLLPLIPGKMSTLEIITDNSVLFDCIKREAWKKWAFNKWLNGKGEPITAKFDWDKFSKSVKQLHKYTIAKPRKNDEVIKELTEVCSKQTSSIFSNLKP